MTPAPISVERLRELLAKANGLPWRWSENGNIVPLGYPHDEWDFEIASVYTERDDDEAPANAELIIEAVNALPALLHQLAERDAEVAELREVRDGLLRDLATTTDTLAARAEAAERAREEATGLLRDCDTVANVRGMLGVPDCIDNNGQPYQSAHLAAFLAASGGKDGR